MGNEQSTPEAETKETINKAHSVFEDFSDVTDDESRGPLSKKRQQQLATLPDNLKTADSRGNMAEDHSHTNSQKLMLPPHPKPQHEKKSSPAIDALSSPPASAKSSAKKRRERQRKRMSIGSMSDTSSMLERTESGENTKLKVLSTPSKRQRLVQQMTAEVEARESMEKAVESDVEPERSREELALREKEPETFGIYADASDSSEAEGREARLHRAGQQPSEPQDEQVWINDDESPLLADTIPMLVTSDRRSTFQPVLETPKTNVAVLSPIKKSDGKYVCPLAEEYSCTTEFTTRKAALRHVETVHMNPGSHTCLVCGKMLSRKDKLKSHMRSHTDAEIKATQNVQENEVEETKPIDSRQDEVNDTEAVAYPDLEPISIVNKQDDDAVLQQGKDSIPAGADSPVTAVTQPDRAARSKRKRASETHTSDVQEQLPTSRKKRRKDQVESLHASEVPNDDDSFNVMAEDAVVSSSSKRNTERLGKTSLVGKHEKPQALRNGSLDGYINQEKGVKRKSSALVTPSSSKLKRSNRETQVFVPRSSNRLVSKTPRKTTTEDNMAARLSNEQDSEQGSRVNELTRVGHPPDSSNGKGKAIENNQETSSDEEHGPNGLATTTAKRTSIGKRSARQDRNSEVQSQMSAEDTKSEENDSEDGSTDDSVSEADDKPFKCKFCSRTFLTQKLCELHETNKKQHRNLHRCSGCPESFTNKKVLAKHIKDTGHLVDDIDSADEQAGLTGKFSDDEINKLNKWRRRFCESNKISEYDFNEMMTQAGKRSVTMSWGWDFIKKAEFLEEFYGQLPNRNRRSMIRFRERNFQNVERTPWEADDDEELKRLFKQHGPRWVEIGQRMNRTQDSVQQRWKNKLNHGQEARHGDWTETEISELMTAVQDLARTLRIDFDQDQSKIPWEMVSTKMNHARTAQQCSNKYRLQTNKRVNGKFIKTPHKSQTPGSTGRTQSKMAKRLEGNSSSKNSNQTSKQYKSSEKIIDSDDSADDLDPHGDENDHQTSQDEHQSAQDHGATSALPTNWGQNGRKDVYDFDSDDQPTSKNPFNAKTPINKMTLTQLHQGTQANSSAKRMSNESRSEIDLPSERRPSPNVAYKSGLYSSPLRPIDNSHLERGSQSQTNANLKGDIGVQDETSRSSSSADEDEDEDQVEIAETSPFRVRNREWSAPSETSRPKKRARNPDSDSDSDSDSSESSTSGDSGGKGDSKNSDEETSKGPSQSSFWNSIVNLSQSASKAFASGKSPDRLTASLMRTTEAGTQDQDVRSDQPRRKR